MPDITYSSEDGETTFSASTAKGEQWMGGPEVVVPDSEAKEYIEAARSASLIVQAFP